MNNEMVFKTALTKLAGGYGVTDLARLKIYAEFFRNKTGMDQPWPEIFEKVQEEAKFFPSIAEIVEVMEEMGLYRRALCDRELAGQIVDEIIAACQSGGNTFEILGRERYEIMKNVLGFVAYDIRNGHIEPRFHRKMWIAKLERHFMNEKQAPALETGEKFTPISLTGMVKEIK